MWGLDRGQIVGFGNSTLDLLRGRECVLVSVSMDAFLTQITVYREFFAGLLLLYLHRFRSRSQRAHSKQFLNYSTVLIRTFTCNYYIFYNELKTGLDLLWKGKNKPYTW